MWFYLFGVLRRFNTVQVLSRRVVGRAEETSTYSLSGKYVVDKQLLEHIHTHNLESSYQSVGHLTRTALLSIQNVHLSLSRGKPIALILTDLSAAFDTIDHSTLFSMFSEIV